MVLGLARPARHSAVRLGALQRRRVRRRRPLGTQALARPSARLVHARARADLRRAPDPPGPGQRPVPEPRRPPRRDHPRARLRCDRHRHRDGHRLLPVSLPALPGPQALSRRDPQLDRDGLPRRGGVPGAPVRLPAHDADEPDARQPDAGDHLRPRHAPRGARPALVHARDGARDRPCRRLADRRDGRHRRRVPGPRDHARRDLHHAPGMPACRRRRAPRTRRSSAGTGRPRAGGCSARATRRGTAEHADRGAPARSRGRRSRCTSTSRSASRCARTATSSCTRVVRRGDRPRAWTPSPTPC